jgi:hypothetical protein
MLEIQIALPSLKLSRERAFRKSNDLDRLDNHCCTQQFLGTHPRGYPTIHLSKSLLQQSSPDNFRHPRRVFLTSPPSLSGRIVPVGGGEYYRPFLTCQRVVQIFFSSPLRCTSNALSSGYDDAKGSTIRRQNIRPGELSPRQEESRTDHSKLHGRSRQGSLAWQRATEAF